MQNRGKIWRSEDEIDATPWMLLNEPTLCSVFPFLSTDFRFQSCLFFALFQEVTTKKLQYVTKESKNKATTF